MARNNFFTEQMKGPPYAAQVATERARIDAIDAIVRGLDQARQERGLSKAELARRVGKQEAFVRRLLTATDNNPTLDTVMALAHELDLEVALQPR